MSTRNILPLLALGAGSRFLFASAANERFAPRIFHAAPTDNPGGGTRTLEERLSDAQTNLTNVTSERDTACTERDTARNELATAQAEVTRLTGQFNALTATATTAQAEVTRLTSELSTMTSARDTAKAGLTSAAANISRLEKLCGLNGVDPASAVSTPEQQSANGLLDKFVKASASEKAAMIRKDGAALYAEARARGIQIG